MYGYPGLHVVDGSAVSANLGVNPSLTITAQAERAMAFWPNRGDADPRPPLGAAYRRVAPSRLAVRPCPRTRRAHCACRRQNGPSDRFRAGPCADIPDLDGVRAVVTGANSGLGFHTVLELAGTARSVVLAVRDEARGADAVAQVLQQVPVARLEVRTLDLADLASVRAFADAAAQEPLDLLVNNAGVMAIPHRRTADGFEMQFGTNHLGHFALTGLLLPALLRGADRRPRGSSRCRACIHRRGPLDRDDLMGERLVLAVARLRAVQAREPAVRARAAAAGRRGRRPAAQRRRPPRVRRDQPAAGRPPDAPAAGCGSVVARLGNVVLAQPAAHGAWPTLRAATDPDAAGGDYYGPGGFAEQRGHPVRVGMSAQARDDADAVWLWERSVELTGVRYDALNPLTP